jgi:protein-L-isoaspartate(D-aspartate) O-methyltransferase
VLDVGSGSGYLVAAMAHIVKPNGFVFGVEHIPELVELSIANVKADDRTLLGKYCDLRASDGRMGLPTEAPFDAIHVGAAAATVPEALT